MDLLLEFWDSDLVLDHIRGDRTNIPTCLQLWTMIYFRFSACTTLIIHLSRGERLHKPTFMEI